MEYHSKNVYTSTSCPVLYMRTLLQGVFDKLSLRLKRKQRHWLGFTSKQVLENTDRITEYVRFSSELVRQLQNY